MAMPICGLEGDEEMLPDSDLSLLQYSATLLLCRLLYYYSTITGAHIFNLAPTNLEPVIETFSAAQPPSIPTLT